MEYGYGDMKLHKAKRIGLGTVSAIMVLLSIVLAWGTAEFMTHHYFEWFEVGTTGAHQYFGILLFILCSFIFVIFFLGIQFFLKVWRQ